MNPTSSFLYDFFALVFKFYILLMGRTSKVKVFHLEHYKKYQSQNKPVIFAFWHENLIPPPFFYYESIGGKRLVSMVSRSKDGEIIAKILEKFNGITIRGSSSRGGAVALKEMAQKMKEEEWDAAMIPDGPKGPPYTLHPGFLKLAQLSGAPILPCGIEIRRKKRISSWDRMKIPYLFNRMALSFGQPIHIPAECTDFSPFELYFKEEMAKATQEAQSFCRK